MYTFIKAIAVRHGLNEKYAEVNIDNVPANTLMSTYRQIYAVLSQLTVTEQMTVDLQTVSAELQVFNGTISEYLTSIGNRALDTIIGIPVIKRNSAIFSDAYQADFDLEPTDLTMGTGVILAEEDRPDIAITRDEGIDIFDYLSLYKKVIVNVNGFYHRSAADSRALYVVGGNQTVRRSGQNHVGLLSFGTISDIEILDINNDQLLFDFHRESTDVEYCHIKFPSGTLTNKTPVLILGGYMLMIDGENLFSTTDDVLTFDPRKYPMMERYFESKDHLDYSNFPIDTLPIMPEWVLLKSFKQEAFYRQLMTMSQSFIVLIDNQHITTERIYPELQTVPHTFMTYERPKYPLVVCEGKHEVYWNQYEDKSWVLTCGNTYKRNYSFQTTSTGDLIGVDDSLILGDAGRYSPGYFLKITSETVDIVVV